MTRFEIGKTYTDNEGIEIQITKRTDKTVSFKFTKANWWESNTIKEFRKKINKFNLNYEQIDFDSSPNAPRITA